MVYTSPPWSDGPAATFGPCFAGRNDQEKETGTMSDTPTAETRKKAAVWSKQLLDATVKRLIGAGVVDGDVVEARPVWMLPHRILISRVWNSNDRRGFLWVVSGEAVFGDYIPGNVAADERAAARHFSLKWQMEAERMRQRGQGKPEAEAHRIEEQAGELVRFAEMMYELSRGDHFWQERPFG